MYMLSILYNLCMSLYIYIYVMQYMQEAYQIRKPVYLTGMKSYYEIHRVPVMKHVQLLSSAKLVVQNSRFLATIIHIVCTLPSQGAKQVAKRSIRFIGSMTNFATRNHGEGVNVIWAGTVLQTV